MAIDVYCWTRNGGIGQSTARLISGPRLVCNRPRYQRMSAFKGPFRVASSMLARYKAAKIELTVRHEVAQQRPPVAKRLVMLPPLEIRHRIVSLGDNRLIHDHFATPPDHFATPIGQNRDHFATHPYSKYL